MFSAEKYLTVNREERCFVTFLAHVVLAHPAAATHVCHVINRRLGGEATLDPNHLEVYVEAAPLRDYWRELGPYKTLSGGTHERRRAVLEAILATYGLNPSQLDRHSFFWTGAAPGQGRLWSPGHWRVQDVKAAGWTSDVTDAVITIKQAFNSHPDLMLASGAAAVFIEAKVESGFGLGQLKNASMAAELLALLSPRYRVKPRLLTLTLQSPPSPPAHAEASIRWRDLVEGPVLELADPFTHQALLRLRSAYPGKY